MHWVVRMLSNAHMMVTHYGVACGDASTTGMSAGGLFTNCAKIHAPLSSWNHVPSAV